MRILLLIDIQCGFDASHELIGYLEKLDYSQYDKVIATKFINNESTLFYKNGYKDMVEEYHTNLLPVLGGKYTDIIEKDTYIVPIEKLYEIVPKEDIESIDIIGVETDACVLATMFALWDEKLNFTLLKARTTGKYGIHEAAKLIMRRNLFFELDDETKVFHKIKDYFS